MPIRDFVAGHTFALLSVLVVTVAAVACSDGQMAQERQEQGVESAAGATAMAFVSLSQEEMSAGGITVESPRTEMRSGRVTASALLHLDETRTARLGAVVDGVVVDTPVQVGTRVHKGGRLAGMHSHELHETRAEYRRALAEQRRAMTELAFLRDAEARTSRLVAAKAASSRELERARTERVASEEAVVIAESEVQRAREGLRHLGIAPESDASAAHDDAIPVMATIDGTVLERLVTPGTAVTVGTPLFVISDLSRLWAIAEVDEALLSSLRLGSSAELAVAAYPDRTFDGRILAIGDTVNPQTRRITVRIALANPDGSLKPQMFATVRLASGQQDPVLLVPSGAVQKIDQQPVLFVEQERGRFVRRVVGVGSERNGLIEIVSGLAAEERVAISGTFLLKSRFVEAGASE